MSGFIDLMQGLIYETVIVNSSYLDKQKFNHTDQIILYLNIATITDM